MAVKITDFRGTVVTTVRDTDSHPDLFLKKPGEYTASFCLNVRDFMMGKYFLTFSLADMTSKRYELLEELLAFEIDFNLNEKRSGWSREGVLLPDVMWNTQAKLTAQF